MRRWLKWLGESFTYRLEDLFGAFTATLLVTWLLTGKADLSLEIGGLSALTENIIASAWYLANRKLWSKVKE